MLSRADAEELGLNLADLREAGPAVVADGSKVRCWTAAIPIRAQVLRPLSSGDLFPWGPVFATSVMFLEHATPLWGQADFFATFKVLFARNVSPARFELRY